MRVETAAGFVLYLMMYTVALPPENNPVLDEHILGAISMVVLAAFAAGDTWGLGKIWASTGIVQDKPCPPVIPTSSAMAPGRLAVRELSCGDGIRAARVCRTLAVKEPPPPGRRPAALDARADPPPGTFGSR